ncbi:hypothetical protein KJ765_02320 [Candidatus Micrarchaeota archaeon]|nr:hypothetical protein [Candidatus Micrarchaeota archaeon]
MVLKRFQLGKPHHFARHVLTRIPQQERMETGKWIGERDQHMLIVSPQIPGPLTASKEIIIKQLYVFPRLDHFDVFNHAREGTKIGSPGHNAPGSIGSIKFDVLPAHLLVHSIQSHYKITGEYAIQPAERKRYAGWRKRAIRKAIELAHQNNRILTITPAAIRKRPHLQADIEKVCRDMRLRIVKRNGFWRIHQIIT